MVEEGLMWSLYSLCFLIKASDEKRQTEEEEEKVIHLKAQAASLEEKVSDLLPFEKQLYLDFCLN